MLTCITSSKQSIEEEGTREEEAHGTQSSKEGVKSLTIQIKDMAIKMSRAYRQCKPCSGSSNNYKKGERGFPDLDAISEGTRPYPYLQQGNSSTSMHGVCGSRLPGGLAAPSNEVTLAKEEEEEEDEQKEWVAQVEPGVQITFMSLPHGCGNNLKRVRFSREMFDKGQAQRWWGENYDRIMELYNVQQFNRQALQTPARSGDERDSSYSRLGSAKESALTPSLNTESKPTKNNYEYSGRRGFFLPETSSSDQGRSQHNSTDVPKGERASVDVSSRTTISSRDDISVANSNMSEIELEWVEQDEPGVYITIRQLADGTRELRRVRFSRERYGEMHAKIWWEQNRERIQSQYL